GLVSDRLAASLKKTALLGALSVIASALTFLLDVAVADAWATLSWVALVNVIVNAAIVWVLSQQVFDRIIKPSGQAERDALGGVSLLKADPERTIEDARTQAESDASMIANRNALIEVAA